MIILNVGCGDDNTRGYGVDIRKTKAVQMLADARYLPFQNHTIALIVMYETLEHISDFMRVLDECYRTLYVGGYLIISVPNVYFYRVLFRWVIKNEMIVTPEHIHAFREGELINACGKFYHQKTLYQTSRWHTEKWYEQLLPAKLKARSMYVTFRKCGNG